MVDLPSLPPCALVSGGFRWGQAQRQHRRRRLPRLQHRGDAVGEESCDTGSRGTGCEDLMQRTSICPLFASRTHPPPSEFCSSSSCQSRFKHAQVGDSIFTPLHLRTRHRHEHGTQQSEPLELRPPKPRRQHQDGGQRHGGGYRDPLEGRGGM